METTYQASCSHCQAKLKCKESQLGRMVRCPRCKHEFTMPMPEPEQVSWQSVPWDTRKTEAPKPKRPTERTPVTPETVPDAQWTKNNVIVAAILGVWAILCCLFLLSAFMSYEQRTVTEVVLGVAVAPPIGTAMVFAYMTPTLIAFSRDHRNTIPIFILNAFLGLTGVFWIACLAWAFSSNVTESRQYIHKVIEKKKG